MYVTGQPYADGQSAEIVDMKDESLTCDDLPNYPIQQARTMGALMNKQPLICGGFYKNSKTNTILWSSMKGIKITMRPHLYGHSNRALGIEDHPTWYHFYYKGPIFPVEM